MSGMKEYKKLKGMSEGRREDKIEYNAARQLNQIANQASNVHGNMDQLKRLLADKSVKVVKELAPFIKQVEEMLQGTLSLSKDIRELEQKWSFNPKGGVESANEATDERAKVIEKLTKGGFNPKDVKEMVDEYWDYVADKYSSSTTAKKAEVISSLWSQAESVSEKMDSKILKKLADVTKEFIKNPNDADEGNIEAEVMAVVGDTPELGKAIELVMQALEKKGVQIKR